ncbi:MAG TPA: sensor histidine kinase [Acidimicrobiales bacterium]|nr:sensor histidine kinase [Acidimicrobiales bacterium]
MTLLAAPRGTREEAFEHEALFYAGTEGFVAQTVPFVREGLAGGEPVLVVVPRPRLRALQDGLGDDARRVTFADMAEVGTNPARIIPAWQDFLAANGSGRRPVRGIGEPIWAGRTPAELVECQRHESLLNVAFAGSGSWRLLCPYDVSALDASVIEEARRSHPLVSAGGQRSSSPVVRDVDAMARPFDVPLPDAPVGADALPFEHGDLASVRGFAAEIARRGGIGGGRLDDFVLAVHEVATNSVRHAGGSGTVKGWWEGDAAVCEVTDAGRIDEPLVGRERPGLRRTGGRGVWLANQLCDLVQIRTFPTGNVVRLHMLGRPTPAH